MGTLDRRREEAMKRAKDSVKHAHQAEERSRRLEPAVNKATRKKAKPKGAAKRAR